MDWMTHLATATSTVPRSFKTNYWRASVFLSFYLFWIYMPIYLFVYLPILYSYNVYGEKSPPLNLNEIFMFNDILQCYFLSFCRSPFLGEDAVWCEKGKI